jgi:heme/copper-type cytochrome/quinol oxidase subunit 3
MDAHASVGHAELEIPYNVHPRPDTGVYNGKLGVWLFLASEVMLFGALFSSLILLRTGAESWPRGYEFLNVKLATFNTFILILSSVTVVMAWSHLRLGDLKKGRIYISATIFCALIFLTAKGFEYSHEFHEGRFPKTNNFLGIYFTMTGLHGLHILGGVIVFLYFLGPGAKMWVKEPERYTNRIEIVGLYWHFVDLVWIFLFPILYLM